MYCPAVMLSESLRSIIIRQVELLYNGKGTLQSHSKLLQWLWLIYIAHGQDKYLCFCCCHVIENRLARPTFMYLVTTINGCWIRRI